MWNNPINPLKLLNYKNNHDSYNKNIYTSNLTLSCHPWRPSQSSSTFASCTDSFENCFQTPKPRISFFIYIFLWIKYRKNKLIFNVCRKTGISRLSVHPSLFFYFCIIFIYFSLSRWNSTSPIDIKLFLLFHSSMTNDIFYTCSCMLLAF